MYGIKATKSLQYPAQPCKPVVYQSFMLLMHNTDTDECALGTFECGERYTCNNTEGSYECVCSPGYELSADKESCEGNLNSCKVRLYI